MKISARAFRVYLASLKPDDAGPIMELANDREVASNIPGMPHPYLAGHAMNLVSFAIERYRTEEEFHMGVRLPDKGLIGLCALSNIDRGNMKAELGYWLGRNYWSRGYGKEALTLMLALGFSKIGLNRIYAKVLTTNERSIRLLRSLGFSNEGTNREEVHHGGRFVDDFSFALLKKEFGTRNDIEITES